MFILGIVRLRKQKLHNVVTTYPPMCFFPRPCFHLRIASLSAGNCTRFHIVFPPACLLCSRHCVSGSRESSGHRITSSPLSPTTGISCLAAACRERYRRARSARHWVATGYVCLNLQATSDLRAVGHGGVVASRSIVLDQEHTCPRCRARLSTSTIRHHVSGRRALISRSVVRRISGQGPCGVPRRAVGRVPQD